MNSSTLKSSVIFFTTLSLLSVLCEIFSQFNISDYISFTKDTQLYFFFTPVIVLRDTEIKKLFRFPQAPVPLLLHLICVMVSAIK